MLFSFPFFADTVPHTGFFATCTGKKITVRVKLGWKLFSSFFFEIPGDQLQDHKLFGTNQGVIDGKNGKGGGGGIAQILPIISQNLPIIPVLKITLKITPIIPEIMLAHSAEAYTRHS